MITKEVLESARTYVSKTRLRAVIYNELIKRDVLNRSTQKPYSKEHIYQVLMGKKHNVEIENVILSLVSDMRDKRKAIEQDYYKNIHNNSQNS